MRLLPQFQHFQCNPFPPLHLLPPLTPPQFTARTRYWLTGPGYFLNYANFLTVVAWQCFSSTNWSPRVRLCGDDEDDERIFGILHSQSVCCIFILVCEAHYENIIYAALVLSTTIPVLPPVCVCLLYSYPVSRGNVIEFNIMAGWTDFHYHFPLYC